MSHLNTRKKERKKERKLIEESTRNRRIWFSFSNVSVRSIVIHVALEVINMIDLWSCSSICWLLLMMKLLFAEDRARRKSGPDDLCTSPSRSQRGGSGGGAIFEALRPRSKSDATRAVKRPTIMSTVKNAVHVSLLNKSSPCHDNPVFVSIQVSISSQIF